VIAYENLALVNEPFVAEFRQAFGDFQRRGWYVLGNEVSSFEVEFASYLGVKYCVGVASGLDAITIALQSLELPKGSEVLVAANSYIACVLGILHAGLKPVLVDPDVSTYNLSTDNLSAHVTQNTSAILAVHMYGKVCPMPEIMSFAKERNLLVVEDCAQAHGASVDGKKAGSFGDAAAFSFYPSKNLGALGDGGAICCANAAIQDRARKLRNYGRSNRDLNEMIGYNSRLDELQAMFLRIKLHSLDKMNKRKQEIAEFYFKNIREEFILPAKDSRFLDVFHIFTVRCKERDDLRDFLKTKGVEAMIHYPLAPSRQEAFKSFDFASKRFPISEEIHETTLSIPSSVYLTESDVGKVVSAVNAFL